MADRRIVGRENLVLISDVSERGIVRNLNERFNADEIYTYLGNVLIVCNPFRWLPLYDGNYVNKFNNGVVAELEPHIYAVSETAFKQMLFEEMNQCVIISGESGAGKTEAAKQIMTYIASVSGSGGNDAQVNKVKNIILDSNPALESFGNAMTLRNNNSSRFGKYFEIKFAPNGTPLGGKITNFLLERGRLTTISQGERTFHIFYQLVRAADKKTRDSLWLSQNPRDYALLAMSDVIDVNNEGGRRNDASDFEETISSLETVGIVSGGQMNLFTICAIILHLSNIDFQATRVNDAEGCQIASRKGQQSLEIAAALLKVEVQKLEYLLTFRTVTTFGASRSQERYEVPQTVPQARASRNSLAKDLYIRTFDLLVNKVNESLSGSGSKTRHSIRQRRRADSLRQFGNMYDLNDANVSIGVLDIYGFEIFKNNFFEQFCINYVNEKLQQLFIELTIRAEQEEYAAEGIAWKQIPFFDNQIVCELIESTGKGASKVGRKTVAKGPRPSAIGGRAGVFAILEDTARTVTAVKASQADDRFLSTLSGMHSSHAHYQPFSSGFAIKHYAGTVNYTIQGFVDANRDTLNKELVYVLQTGGSTFLRALYPEEIDFNNRTQAPGVGSKVRKQANDLIDTLKMCEPHYVRCIKSNHRKAPKVFEQDMVSHQVRYLNLLENVKIRRAGFACRVKFINFNKRFKVLGKDTVQSHFFASASPDQITNALLQAAAARLPALTNSGEVQFGQTKLFIKSPEVYFSLQALRRTMLGEVAAKLQRFWRRFKAQRKNVDLKARIIQLFEMNHKPTSALDVLGNFESFYITNRQVLQDMGEILGYYREQEVVYEKLCFTDSVGRLAGDLSIEPVYLIVTDQAFYLMKYEVLSVAKKKKKRRTKKSTSVEEVPQLTLKKRVPLNRITGLSLTQFADDFLRIECSPDQKIKPNKEGWADQKKVKRCMASNEGFSFFGKSKYRCHFTGGIYVKDYVVKTPVPEKGFYTPVDVYKQYAAKLSSEMIEDVVLLTEKKAELTSVLLELLKKGAPGAGSGPISSMNGPGFQQPTSYGRNINPEFANAWRVQGAEPMGILPCNVIQFSVQAQLPGLQMEMSKDGQLMIYLADEGLDRRKQQQLRDFLAKREHRKRMKRDARQRQREAERQNQQRYESEDKARRHRERDMKKAKRLEQKEEKLRAEEERKEKAKHLYRAGSNINGRTPQNGNNSSFSYGKVNQSNYTVTSTNTSGGAKYQKPKRNNGNSMYGNSSSSISQQAKIPLPGVTGALKSWQQKGTSSSQSSAFASKSSIGSSYQRAPGQFSKSTPNARSQTYTPQRAAKSNFKAPSKTAVNTSYNRPTNASHSRPTNASYNRPTNASYGRPTNASYGRPTNVSQQKNNDVSTSGFTQPSKTEIPRWKKDQSSGVLQGLMYKNNQGSSANVSGSNNPGSSARSQGRFKNVPSGSFSGMSLQSLKLPVSASSTSVMKSQFIDIPKSTKFAGAYGRSEEPVDVWEEHYDDTHKRNYYYNTRTEESVWVKPPEFKG